MSSATLVDTLLDFICRLFPVRTQVCWFPIDCSARLKSLGTDVAVFVDAAAEHVGGNSCTTHDVCSLTQLSWDDRCRRLELKLAKSVIFMASMNENSPLYSKCRYSYQWTRIGDIEMVFEMQWSDLNIGLMKNGVLGKGARVFGHWVQVQKPFHRAFTFCICCVCVAPHVALLYHALWKVRLI